MVRSPLDTWSYDLTSTLNVIRFFFTNAKVDIFSMFLCQYMSTDILAKHLLSVHHLVPWFSKLILTICATGAASFFIRVLNGQPS